MASSCAFNMGYCRIYLFGADAAFSLQRINFRNEACSFLIKICTASVFFDDDREASSFSAFIGKTFVATTAFAAAANGAAVFRYARFYDGCRDVRKMGIS